MSDGAKKKKKRNAEPQDELGKARRVLERLRAGEAIDDEGGEFLAALPEMMTRALTELVSLDAEADRLLEHARRQRKRVPAKLRREIEQLRAEIRRGPPKA